MTKISIILASLLTGCASQVSVNSSAVHMGDIQYISLNLGNVAVFTGETARFGPALALSPVWPSSGAKYFSPAENIVCVSVGPQGNSEDYGIKRPIVAGDNFNCGDTIFVVTKCFRNCQSAILRRSTFIRSTKKSFVLNSYLYVDSCLGILLFSDTDIVGGVPLNASWLRGDVGILADRHYPSCQGLK